MLVDFKLCEKHPIGDGNMWNMFKVIRSDRTEIEYGRFSDFQSVHRKKTTENVVWSPLYCSLLGNRGRAIQRWCQNFDRKLGNSNFCACAVQIRSKTAQNDWHDVRMLKVSMLRNGHIFICPIAIAYSMGQIIKSVCVCQCVCLSVCPSASTLTVAFLDRFLPKLAQT